MSGKPDKKLHTAQGTFLLDVRDKIKNRNDAKSVQIRKQLEGLLDLLWKQSGSGIPLTIQDMQTVDPNWKHAESKYLGPPVHGSSSSSTSSLSSSMAALSLQKPQPVASRWTPSPSGATSNRFGQSFASPLFAATQAASSRSRSHSRASSQSRSRANSQSRSRPSPSDAVSSIEHAFSQMMTGSASTTAPQNASIAVPFTLDSSAHTLDAPIVLAQKANETWVMFKIASARPHQTNRDFAVTLTMDSGNAVKFSFSWPNPTRDSWTFALYKTGTIKTSKVHKQIECWVYGQWIRENQAVVPVFQSIRIHLA